MTALPGRLESEVRSTPWLLEALRAARDVDPPDWLVGGGVLRDLVWDRLHGRSRPPPPRDLDLAFFDPTRPDPARDAEVEQALADRLPGVPWDAKNQAAVHTWYGRVFGVGPVAPLRSAADGSPSTTTAAGSATSASPTAGPGLRSSDADPGGRLQRPGGVPGGPPPATGCGSAAGGLQSPGRVAGPPEGESSPRPVGCGSLSTAGGQGRGRG
jgi:hypothetical protein